MNQDSTLVDWLPGKRDYTSWRWWHGTVPIVLKEVHEKGLVRTAVTLSSTHSQTIELSLTGSSTGIS